jgi:hypothetical protein
MVALDVGPKPLDGEAVSADLLFIGPDHIARRVVPAVRCQTIAVVVQLKLLLPKALFILAQVLRRTGLCRRKSTHQKRQGQ